MTTCDKCGRRSPDVVIHKGVHGRIRTNAPDFVLPVVGQSDLCSDCAYALQAVLVEVAERFFEQPDIARAKAEWERGEGLEAEEMLARRKERQEKGRL